MSADDEHEDQHEHYHDDEPGNAPGSEPGKDDCGCGTPGSGDDCQPDLIDHLKCQAAGIAAQAAYNATTQPDLEKARTDYATARTAYRAARTTAALEVQGLKHQITQLIERIRCQFPQETVRHCLDRAFRDICVQLEACDSDSGCCSQESCEFDRECPEGYDELVSRIAEYEAALEREKACFATLVAEPAALTKRVADVKAKIDAVAAELAKDPATVDLKTVYASALVAERELGLVWNGFPRTTDFMDCICRALTCWTKAADAISALKGCLAVMDCKRDARAKHCDDLRTRTVEEILLQYEKLCGSERCEDPADGPSDSPAEDYTPPDDGPCDCGHGHPHHHDHHGPGHEHEHGHGHEYEKGYEQGR